MKSIDIRNIEKLKENSRVFDKISSHLSSTDICLIVAEMAKNNEDFEDITSHSIFNKASKMSRENLLIKACEEGYYKLVKNLVSLGVNPNCHKGDAIYKSIKNKRWNIVYFLLDNGAIFFNDIMYLLEEVIKNNGANIAKTILEKSLKKELTDDNIVDLLCKEKMFSTVRAYCNEVSYPIKENYKRLHNIAKRTDELDRFEKIFEAFL